MRRSIRLRGARRLINNAVRAVAGLAEGLAVVVDAHAEVCHVRASRGHVRRARTPRGTHARRVLAVAAVRRR